MRTWDLTLLIREEWKMTLEELCDFCCHICVSYICIYDGILTHDSLYASLSSNSFSNIRGVWLKYNFFLIIRHRFFKSRKFCHFFRHKESDEILNYCTSCLLLFWIIFNGYWNHHEEKNKRVGGRKIKMESNHIGRAFHHFLVGRAVGNELQVMELFDSVFWFF